jgi:hypothetical protein
MHMGNPPFRLPPLGLAANITTANVRRSGVMLVNIGWDSAVYSRPI